MTNVSIAFGDVLTLSCFHISLGSVFLESLSKCEKIPYSTGVLHFNSDTCDCRAMPGGERTDTRIGVRRLGFSWMPV